MDTVIKQFHISFETLKRILEMHDVKLKTRTTAFESIEQELEIVNRYNNGESVQTLSNEYKISKTPIYRIINKYKNSEDNNLQYNSSKSVQSRPEVSEG